MEHRRPPKLSASLYVGGVRIFYTMCTFRRLRLFENASTVTMTRGGLLQSAECCAVEIIAYCFMPDHLHVLVAGKTEHADAKRFASSFRQRTSFAYKKTSPNRLWQDGYFDRHLRDEDATFDVVSYIVANPVRAGLCRHPREYEFLGSPHYSLDEICLSVQWRPLG